MAFSNFGLIDSGGAGIRHAFRALYGVLLDQLWVACQAQSKIPEGVDLTLACSSRETLVPCAGWIILFPKPVSITTESKRLIKQGKLLKRPEKEEAEKQAYIVNYFPIASVGQTFSKVKVKFEIWCNFLFQAEHSADSIAMFAVKGNDETEVKENLFKAKKWYEDNSEWELHQ